MIAAHIRNGEAAVLRGEVCTSQLVVLRRSGGSRAGPSRRARAPVGRPPLDVPHTYDPTNLFHINQNIPPAAAPSPAPG